MIGRGRCGHTQVGNTNFQPFTHRGNLSWHLCPMINHSNSHRTAFLFRTSSGAVTGWESQEWGAMGRAAQHLLVFPSPGSKPDVSTWGESFWKPVCLALGKWILWRERSRLLKPWRWEDSHTYLFCTSRKVFFAYSFCSWQSCVC